jgi:DNA-binding response OmpR family regulator
MNLRAKILLVDDEGDFRSSLALLLEVHGHDVFAAENAIDAWEILVREKPDVLITDLMMPRVSGLDLCRRVREDPKLEALPIVMLSAAPAPALGYGIWVDRYLTKPAPFEEVLKAVEEVLLPDVIDHAAPAPDSVKPPL